ncbi:MAG: hypothetical protein JWO74_5050 [Solirubrobacterales bacterium]|nr:hypothetical protein [Solirubrobacterales bacterium]
MAHQLTLGRALPGGLAAPAWAARHVVVLVVLGLTLATFLWPSAPTYDPWAWIIWGREILHLDLSTVQGPSWKPLPVLLTTPFSAFGGLAPDLWLFVARAGAIAGVAMAYRLGRRLGGGAAGAAAAAAYALAPWTVFNGAVGNSEGLLVALTLGAVDRHLEGRLRPAYLCALGAAMLRPEVWPFVGLYALWLIWREPGLRPLVVAGLASLPVLWLLPELWGSGDLLRAAHRARTPRADSAAFADHPVQVVLDQFRVMLTPAVWVGLGLLVLTALARRAPGRRELAVAGALLAGSVLWVAEVAVMTNDGFSGNARYLILPAALACLLAGVGLGWAVRAVAGAPRRVPAAAIAVAAAVAFGVPSVHDLPPVRDSVRYEAKLTEGLAAAVDQAGGAKRLLACGNPYAGPFQVPSVAWQLHVHTVRVQLTPKRPAVVFRARPNATARARPSVKRLGGEAAVRTFANTGGWRIVGACRGTGG